jgi:hypothetical protein
LFKSFFKFSGNPDLMGLPLSFFGDRVLLSPNACVSRRATISRIAGGSSAHSAFSSLLHERGGSALRNRPNDLRVQRRAEPVKLVCNIGGIHHGNNLFM